MRGKDILNKGTKMNKGIRFGSLFILVGVGLPLVLFFFQSHGILIKFKKPIHNIISYKPDSYDRAEMKHKVIKELHKVSKEFEKRLSDESKVSFWELRSSYSSALDDYFNNYQHLIFTTKHTQYKGYDLPYRYFIGIGIALIIAGINILIFSLPAVEKVVKKKKSRKKADETLTSLDVKERKTE